jgi:hypothetical protein
VIFAGGSIPTQRAGAIDNFLVKVRNRQLKIEIVQTLTADRL